MTEKDLVPLGSKSFEAKNKAGQLLDIAKRAVEIAIEQNEDAAIRWLKEQTKEMKV